ncbi:MAG: hypothetical protein R3B95_00780 [Nitrospirales bacterium]|nr:hypothetical protein [Nitrospirales bacterium]
MKIISPKLSSTQHSSDLRAWCPSSFESFLFEMDHIINSCEGKDPFPLFRGQINSGWFLDSKFLRFSIKRLFKLTNHHQLPEKMRQNISFHKVMTYLFLLKGTIGKPSQELLEAEKVYAIDPWFEWFKHLQQYPENDRFINGTFLLDWTWSKNIGLYFATYEGRGRNRVVSSGDGALWIYDAVSTGQILQTKKLDEIMAMMENAEFLNGDKTFPLIFHPTTQIIQSRSKNQDPIYVDTHGLTPRGT